MNWGGTVPSPLPSPPHGSSLMPHSFIEEDTKGHPPLPLQSHHQRPDSLSPVLANSLCALFLPSLSTPPSPPLSLTHTSLCAGAFALCISHCHTNPVPAAFWSTFKDHQKCLLLQAASWDLSSQKCPCPALQAPASHTPKPPPTSSPPGIFVNISLSRTGRFN